MTKLSKSKMPPRRPSTVPSLNDQPNSIQLKCIECVQRTFAKQHLDQLRLDNGTHFFDPFSKIYSEEVNVNEIDIQKTNEMNALMKEQRLDIWLHAINKCVSSNRFVGATIIQSILEMILSMNQKFDETAEKTQRRLQSASLLFEKIVDNFPSSWPVCSKVYKSLLYSPLNMEIDYSKIRMNSKDGLFSIILALLDEVFREKDSGDNNDQNGFDSMMNFHQFEKVESGKSCYTKLTRTEKIDRLFIVLNLLIKLIEIDLSIWIQRYPFRTRHFMSNSDTCPLIAHLLWKGKVCGETNVLMRDIFQLFLMAIWIDFPDDKTNVLARMVHLMSVAVNLSENCDNDNLISYPSIKRLTLTYAAEMAKSIESFPYTTKFYMKVIDKIRSPAISMLITQRILSKFTKEFENVSVRKIFESISNESYKEYDEATNVSVSQRSDYSGTYPSYDPKRGKQSKHLLIDRNDFLTLTFHLFDGYVGVHRTPELLQALLSDAVAASSYDSEREKYEKMFEKFENEKNHRLDFDQIVKDWNRLKLAAKKLAKSDAIPIVPLKPCHNVYLQASEFVRYEEDFVYLVKLNKIVEESVGVSEVFEKWHNKYPVN